MTSKYGMFKEAPYMTPSSGEDSKPKEKRPEGEGDGLNMKIGTQRTGKGNDATFSRMLLLSEGDKYVDPLRLALQAKAASKGKNVTDAPFKQPTPMRKSACPGDYFGTSGKLPHQAGYVEPKLKKGDVPEKPRGIYTSVAKKGSYGFNKTTLSERAGAKGVASEYEYQHDPDALRDQKRLAEREKSRKACVTEAPFKPSNPPKKGSYGIPNTTISKGKGVAGEWEYVMGANNAPGKDAQKETDDQPAPAPFRPSNAFASQRIQPIEYLHDPEGPKIKAEAEKRKKETERLAQSGAWRPNMGNKTDMVRSIIRMNLR